MTDNEYGVMWLVILTSLVVTIASFAIEDRAREWVPAPLTYQPITRATPVAVYYATPFVPVRRHYADIVGCGQGMILVADHACPPLTVEDFNNGR